MKQDKDVLIYTHTHSGYSNETLNNIIHYYLVSLLTCIIQLSSLHHNTYQFISIYKNVTVLSPYTVHWFSV